MKQFKPVERYTPRQSASAGYYLNDVSRGNKILSPEDELEIATKASNGDMEARNKLVRANLRFVLSVAKMYTRDPDIYQDLVSVGNIGMIEAAEKFDPSRGFKFISYAVWHIRKEMIKYLVDNSRIVRMPGNRNNYLVRVRRLAAELSSKLDREPTTEELVEVLKGEENEKRALSLLFTQHQITCEETQVHCSQQFSHE
jgi:RNA polymerase primary sigma factor